MALKTVANYLVLFVTFCLPFFFYLWLCFPFLSFVHQTQSRIAAELLLCMVRKSKEAGKLLHFSVSFFHQILLILHCRIHMANLSVLIIAMETTNCFTDWVYFLALFLFRYILWHCVQYKRRKENSNKKEFWRKGCRKIRIYFFSLLVLNLIFAF